MKISSFKGIRNTEPVRSIPNDALSAAFDVDISDQGALSQRNGYSQSKAISNITTAYSTLDQTGYVISNGILNRVLPDLSLIPIVPSTATDFCDFSKVLFTNDGLKIEDDVATDLKHPAPEHPPTLNVVSGALPAGRYGGVYCYRSASGLEGGSSPLATIELASVGGISVDPITPPAGYTVQVYLSDANGAVYYNSEGGQLNAIQLLAGPFPDGVEKVAFFEGKLFCSQPLSDGSTLIRYSNPFYFHLFDYTKDYLVVKGTVLSMAATKMQLIICTDAAIYSYTEENLTPLADYGVVKGRAAFRTVEERVLVHTKRGDCEIGIEGFVNKTEKKALFPVGVQCSTAVVLQDGIMKFVTLSDGSGAAFNVRV